MIISHRHKFIFIKTRKTASTSVEVFLSRICGDQDIVTPFGRPEPGHEPRNHTGFRNHMTAAKVIDKIGLDTWREYFTFCIERNPWDKAVSSFWFRKYKGKTPEERTFDDFVRNDKLPVDFRRYLQKGALLVNFIGKFETLEQDLQFVLDQIGADCEITLPRAKGVMRQDKKHYSAYYTEELAQIVRHRFRREISLLNYKFVRHE